MPDSASQFIGSIPENYDKGLGPNIFTDYAADLAGRAKDLAPDAVLELAAGTGIVSRKLRDALPSATRLVVTDLNPPMLDVARAKFGGDERTEFVQADALALPFADAEFDLIVCQFGVMFFPDKIASFREAARVLRPGGRYVFNTWGTMAENPFSEVAHTVATRFFPDDPPSFYRVPFSYADPEAVKSDLRAAGLVEVGHDTIALQKTVTDRAGFVRGLVYGNPLIDEIRQRGSVDPDQVVAAISEEFEDRFGPAPVTMPLRATVFSGRAA